MTDDQQEVVILVLGDVAEVALLDAPQLLDEADYILRIVHAMTWEEFEQSLHVETVDLLLTEAYIEGADTVAAVVTFRGQRPFSPTLMIAETDQTTQILEAYDKGLDAHILRAPQQDLSARLLFEVI
ncbi:MAG: hypothetical protein ACNA8W_25360, partial [Bradymonadaceae bacterium]